MSVYIQLCCDRREGARQSIHKGRVKYQRGASKNRPRLSLSLRNCRYPKYLDLNLNGIRRKEANSGYYIRQGCVRMLLSV